MIKIYTDNTFLEDESYKAYMYPLLTLLKEKPKSLSGVFLKVKNLQESDIAILPIAIEYLYKKRKKAYVSKFLNEAKLQNKPVFTFTSGDIGLTVNHFNIFNLRLGGFKSKMDANTFVMPPFINDPYILLNKEISYLKKTELPTIGFVGHSNGSAIKLIKEFLLYLKTTCKIIFKQDYIDYQSFYPSSFFRHKYLLKLNTYNDELITRFIFRKHYRAGAKTEVDKHETSLAFYNNIFDNGYIFCIRGVGNWSVRFYETLAMGRIPVLIDTDCKLPFSNTIDWKKHCIIIKENDFKMAKNKIKKFHSKFSNDEFIVLQQSNRKLWNDYFTKQGFFKSMAIDIEKLIKK